MTQHLTRRTLVKSLAWAGLGAPLTMPKLVRAAAPSERVRHASIGAAGMAWVDISNIMRAPNVELVAVCDVDQRRFGQVAKHHPSARRYQDWRELLDKESNNIDSVNVTVPDHMHAPIAHAVMQQGKHLYCQKPLAKWIEETRRLTEMAARMPIVTQLGIQNHSRTEFRLAVQLLRDGAIGRVKHIHAWSNKRWAGGSGRPAQADSVPAELNWDLWLGVAPERPFTRNAYHPGTWRNWRDFGCGLLGDMAAHVFDPLMTALEPGPVRTLRSEGPAPDVERWPGAATLHFDFAGNERTVGDTLRLTWYDGDTLPPAEVRDMLKDWRLPQTGSLTIGEHGAMLLPHVAAPRLLPQERFQGYAYPKLDPVDHYRQFINACRGQDEASTPFAYGGPLTETILAGTIAQHFPGQTLHWNASEARFTDREANDLLSRPYRDGWTRWHLS